MNKTLRDEHLRDSTKRAKLRARLLNEFGIKVDESVGISSLKNKISREERKAERAEDEALKRGAVK